MRCSERKHGIRCPQIPEGRQLCEPEYDMPLGYGCRWNGCGSEERVNSRSDGRRPGARSNIIFDAPVLAPFSAARVRRQVVPLYDTEPSGPVGKSWVTSLCSPGSISCSYKALKMKVVDQKWYKQRYFTVTNPWNAVLLLRSNSSLSFKFSRQTSGR